MEGYVYLDPNATIFSSTLAIDEAVHLDSMGDHNYNVVLKSRLVVGIMWFAVAIYFLVTNWNSVLISAIWCAFVFINAILALLSYRRLGKALKSSFVSSVRKNAGQSPIDYNVRFADKIYVLQNNYAHPLAYEYESVRLISENNNYYNLLTDGTLIIVAREQVYDERLSFANFIFSRCPNIKRKRVQNVRNGKRNCLIFVVTQFVAAAVLTIAWAAVHFTYFSAYYFG